MLDTQVNKKPQPKTVAEPKNSSDGVVMALGAIPSQDKIRGRAYELYESRGREPGQHEQDWLRAEQESLKRAK
jgi:hypothetical protein